jgi:hypothetical protein
VMNWHLIEGAAFLRGKLASTFKSLGQSSVNFQASDWMYFEVISRSATMKRSEAILR